MEFKITLELLTFWSRAACSETFRTTKPIRAVATIISTAILRTISVRRPIMNLGIIYYHENTSPTLTLILSLRERKLFRSLPFKGRVRVGMGFHMRGGHIPLS